MFKSKKAQWARAAMREQRSRDRAQRMEHTKQLFKSGLDADEIAINVGVSGNTVRQYLRELKPIIAEEKNHESLSNEFNSLFSKIQEKGDVISSNIEFTDFINLYSNLLLIESKIIISSDKLGYAIGGQKINLKNTIKAGYSVIFSSIVTSFISTINSKENSKTLSSNEIEIINKNLEKWSKIKANCYMLKDDYDAFKKKISNYEASGKIKSMNKVITHIENYLDFNKNLKLYERSVIKALNNVDLDISAIPKKGLNSINNFYKCLICNIFIPGLGTIIFSKKSTKRIAIGIFQFFWIFFLDFIFVFWIWAFIYTFMIKKELD